MSYNLLAYKPLALALSEWRHWALPLESEPVVLERLSSGKTNQSFLLKADDDFLVLRLEAANSRSLGIDRNFEKKVLSSLDHDLCAKHIYANAVQHYSVFEYIKGRVWTRDDLKSADQLSALECVISKIQATNITGSIFNYVAYLQQYQNQLIGQDVPPRLMRQNEFSEFLIELENALAKTWKPVLCHHDLGPDNIIETADGLKIIDWEYAGLGYPDFDKRYVDSWLFTDPEQGLQGDVMDKLIYWLNYYWTLIQE